MRMTTTDEALATAAAGGDRDAFATLIERRYDDLFRLTFRLTGRRAEAEDLTQDTTPTALKIHSGTHPLSPLTFISVCNKQRITSSCCG